MAAALADLHIALIFRCDPDQFKQALAKDRIDEVFRTERSVECGRACFADSKGFASPDVAEIVFDPWLHAGFVVYGDNATIVSGPDLSSVVYNWLPRAQAAEL